MIQNLFFAVFKWKDFLSNSTEALVIVQVKNASDFAWNYLSIFLFSSKNRK